MAAELACDWHTVNDAVRTYGEAPLKADRVLNSLLQPCLQWQPLWGGDHES